MYDLIIIGGGPSGVAAGIYASRKALKALLLTKDFGGQSINSASIENFIGFKSISGIDFAKNLEEHLRAQKGIEIKDGVFVTSIKKDEQGFKITDSQGNVFQSKTILITLGSSYKKLNIPGEKEFEGKGVFYCSICDAPLMKDKVVAVIGGGNSGLESAMDLVPYASKIFILEHSDKPKGDQVTLEKIVSSGKVELLTNSKTEKIEGEQFVNSLEYIDSKSGEKKRLEVSGIFVAIGYKPNTDLVKDLVKLDDYGRIVVDHRTYQTSCTGIWAAGDITDGLYNQINPAIGDAIKAVLNINDFLK
ncbi:MAG: FAD-dependent oxidoreductase [Candidatus Paceibacterota bacterium]|jgi:alkyl hydroperoxide reductase subunit AhpF